MIRLFCLPLLLFFLSLLPQNKAFSVQCTSFVESLKSSQRKPVELHQILDLFSGKQDVLEAGLGRNLEEVNHEVRAQFLLALSNRQVRGKNSVEYYIEVFRTSSSEASKKNLFYSVRSLVPIAMGPLLARVDSLEVLREALQEGDLALWRSLDSLLEAKSKTTSTEDLLVSLEAEISIALRTWFLDSARAQIEYANYNPSAAKDKTPLILRKGARVDGIAINKKMSLQESIFFLGTSETALITIAQTYSIPLLKVRQEKSLQDNIFREYKILENDGVVFPIAVDHQSGAGTLFQAQQLKVIREVLREALTPLEQHILMLRDYLGYSRLEAAAIVGKNASTLEPIYNRARSKLKHPSRSNRLRAILNGPKEKERDRGHYDPQYRLDNGRNSAASQARQIFGKIYDRNLSLEREAESRTRKQLVQELVTSTALSKLIEIAQNHLDQVLKGRVRPKGKLEEALKEEISFLRGAIARFDARAIDFYETAVRKYEEEFYSLKGSDKILESREKGLEELRKILERETELFEKRILIYERAFEAASRSEVATILNEIQFETVFE